MAEYIDRDDYCHNVCLCDHTKCDKHKCTIWDAPLADVAPVRHGRWHEWYPGDIALIMTGEEMLYECSDCTAKFADQSRFCPNCGAKMDEEYNNA